MSDKVRRLCLLGLICSLALVFSLLENMIAPVPALPPGAKLGLSNIAVLTASAGLGPLSGMAVALCKGLFAGVTRGLTAGIMSLAGGLLSALVSGLLLVSKKNPFSLIGVGVIGAVCHNLGQFAVAYCMAGSAMVNYLPLLILLAVPAGAATGLTAAIILPRVPALRTNGLQKYNSL